MKIGWAKPVPVNAAYFKNPLRDMMWVSFAGPGANLLTAVASGIVLKLLGLISAIIPMFILISAANMLAASVWINVMLAVFNLIPIPPLDGSKIILVFLPSDLAAAYIKIEPFGFIILLVLFYTGIISKILFPLINFAQGLIMG
jgi:Zn-dependent protease